MQREDCYVPCTIPNPEFMACPLNCIQSIYKTNIKINNMFKHTNLRKIYQLFRFRLCMLICPAKKGKKPFVKKMKYKTKNETKKLGSPIYPCFQSFLSPVFHRRVSLPTVKNDMLT